ncbi:hypothetical protein TWF730_007472 [Orbilia blumenaviensis]|uniref:Uncharacterized protein n=1 Tax=Orbilia blumenaviensis TaxID=1796055 RepID=A0AAV9VBP9_9PEZI
MGTTNSKPAAKGPEFIFEEGPMPPPQSPSERYQWDESRGPQSSSTSPSDIPDLPKTRVPRHKAAAKKVKHPKSTLSGDSSDEWVTQSGSDDEITGSDSVSTDSSDSDTSESSSTSSFAFKRRGLRHPGRMPYYHSESDSVSLESTSDYGGRFIDRSFRHGLPPSIKRWEDIRFVTNQERKSDRRLIDRYNGPRRPQKSFRTAYQGPVSIYRPSHPQKLPAATWGEIKRLLESKGKDTTVFEERAREEEEHYLRDMEVGGLDKIGISKDENYHRINRFIDSGNNSDSESDLDENYGRIPLTKRELYNPLNWSITFAPLLFQDFIIWLKHAEK